MTADVFACLPEQSLRTSIRGLRVEPETFRISEFDRYLHFDPRAPRGSPTRIIARRVRVARISIHGLCGGARPAMHAAHIVMQTFQSTGSAGEPDYGRISEDSIVKVFQSTGSAGEPDSGLSYLHAFTSISIHGLRGGARLDEDADAVSARIFQSTGSAGEPDTPYHLVISGKKHFNPRAPRGSPTVFIPSSFDGIVFQSTGSAGEPDFSRSACANCGRNFNPRAPRGSPTSSLLKSATPTKISIHGLRGGARRLQS